jgi:hypothetical protein
MISDKMVSVISEVVTPVKTGVQKTQGSSKNWIPAFAGITETAEPKGLFSDEGLSQKAFLVWFRLFRLR